MPRPAAGLLLHLWFWGPALPQGPWSRPSRLASLSRLLPPLPAPPGAGHDPGPGSREPARLLCRGAGLRGALVSAAALAVGWNRQAACCKRGAGPAAIMPEALAPPPTPALHLRLPPPLRAQPRLAPSACAPGSHPPACRGLLYAEGLLRASGLPPLTEPSPGTPPCPPAACGLWRACRCWTLPPAASRPTRRPCASTRPSRPGSPTAATPSGSTGSGSTRARRRLTRPRALGQVAPPGTTKQAGPRDVHARLRRFTPMVVVQQPRVPPAGPTTYASAASSLVGRAGSGQADQGLRQHGHESRAAC